MYAHGNFPILAVFVGISACESTPSEKREESIAGQSFETESFTVEPGEERYLCFTERVSEDLDLDEIEYVNNPVVHHLALVETLVAEPDEPFECDVFFKSSWLPLFANGLGDGKLELPEGAAFQIEKDTQLLVQLHLLNTTSAPVTSKVELRLHRAQTEVTSRAGIYGFGTTLVELPARQVTTISNDCVIEDAVNIFAVFPHMHTRGQSMRFSVGPSESQLQEVYRLDDWNFDAQAINPFELSLKPGDLTRVECTFDNDTDDVIRFGESTLDEMCFFTSFRTDYETLDGCIELGAQVGMTPGGDGGIDEDGPCEPTENEVGIGRACTRGGDECAGDTACSADLNEAQESPEGFCMKLGCAASAECGANAGCCTPAASGGLINICLPSGCRPSDCTPVP